MMLSLSLAPAVSTHIRDMPSISTLPTRLPSIEIGIQSRMNYVKDIITGQSHMVLIICSIFVGGVVIVGIFLALRSCARRCRTVFRGHHSVWGSLDAAERGDANDIVSLAPHEDFTLAPNTSWWEVVERREAEDPTFGEDLVIAPEYCVEDEVLSFDPDYCLKPGALWWEVVEAQEKAGS
ncbi:uncharacterized protein LOC124146160 [Haliotis rufescens]|uniref:uncharacterized protein LOC124146160 n=1 Tax=Haliotis rufescens TaxID=6454 RepID=UPI00201EB4C7|nr:uncharacterized protein LOC124146160 [Haliotis rufescens]